MPVITSSQYHQLCFDQRHWTDAISDLIQHPSNFAVGSIWTERSMATTRLIVNDLHIVNRTPLGSERSSLEAWCVVMFAADSDSHNIEVSHLITRFAPKFSQHLVVLVVGVGHDRNGWFGWSIHRSSIEPLAGFHVVGPNGFSTNITEDSGHFNYTDTDTDDRWSRVAGAVGAGHPFVRSSSVAIVGCSRSGTIAATQFAALGVRRLVLIDGDRMDAHNLDGSYFATPDDLGRTKVSVLADRLHAYRPDLTIGIVDRLFDDDGSIESSTPVDLLVTCVDNDAARDAVSRVASRRLISHLDIGTAVMSPDDDGPMAAYADVRFLYPRDGCVRCVAGAQSSTEDAFWRFALPGTGSPFRSLPWHEQRAGSLITINSIAVSTGVQTWLASLQGRLVSSFWHRVALSRDGSIGTDSAPVSAAPGCRICESDD